VTVSGQDTLIWLTQDEVISINVVSLSLQATSRALYRAQEKVEMLESDLGYTRSALHFSEEIISRRVREKELDSVQLDQLRKDLKKALRKAGFYKAWGIASTTIAVVLLIMVLI